MTTSLRALAMDMDPFAKNTPISLDNIGRLHRWGDDTFETGVLYRPEPLSLGNLGHKHEKSLKFLWLNAYLLPGLELDTPVYSGKVFEGAPARNFRACEIGHMIRNSEYDIAAMCEVFTTHDKDLLLSEFNPSPNWATGHGEGKIKFETLGIETLTIETLGSGLLTVLPRNYGLLGWSGEKFNEKGDWKRDADAWANKGILRVVVDTGFNTKLEIYSTHLIYGGGLIGDISTQERYDIQTKQLDQLVSFINRNRDPSNFLMVVGDFNIFANEELYNGLRARMEDQLGLEDVWTRYAIPRYGAKIGQTEDSASCTPERQQLFEHSIHSDDYADDYTSDTVSEEGRIDYIFIQKPSEKHDMHVDVSRPRRLRFPRDVSAYEYEKFGYLSDHTGLELRMFFSSPIQHTPAEPKPE